MIEMLEFKELSALRTPERRDLIWSTFFSIVTSHFRKQQQKLSKVILDWGNYKERSYFP